MHPVNEVLSLFGLEVARRPSISKMEKQFKEKYEKDFEKIKDNQRGFEVYKAYRFDIGECHEKPQMDFEAEFIANILNREKPASILDVGSYRHFLLGLLAHYKITTVDIRKRESLVDNETVLTCDAKTLTLPDDSFDCVMTMETLPHVGIGRYGDEVEIDADIKVFNDMVRVLKPGGVIIFTIPMIGGNASIAWNARRNYSYEMMKELCEGLDLVEETFFDRRSLRYCTREELTTDPTFFDYYFGCWRKR